MTARQPASIEASAHVYKGDRQGVLREQFGRRQVIDQVAVEITPLRHHNARVYELNIGFGPEIRDTADAPDKPGVGPSAPADHEAPSMLNEKVRIQDEVAIMSLMSLMREAVGPIDNPPPSIVPEVYGRQAVGVPIGGKFVGPGDGPRRKSARCSSNTQSFKLRDSVKTPTTYGDLNFSDGGGLRRRP
ncbi:hypothetical protein CTA2_4949 [Colletotrichum tanaceti]|uniref:Uncharacterized protein n=1 Tax=Colletotrichum tanaceti TaxID=1306861 RepID=A0A4U6XP04_9PEZI|nr:hypothetical protein CTA2_4949 [Colletotrichum tanaceti]TKW57474.1 hypothetical protein CTA1_8541 [Colletotrichum tanaceti]